MPAIAMWRYKSPWSRPHCVPLALSVTKWLVGANPSCHCWQWIIDTSLSPFMTRAHINYQLQTQQTALYTHMHTHTHSAISSVNHIKLAKHPSSNAWGAARGIKNQLIVLQFGDSFLMLRVKPMERCAMALLISGQYGGSGAWKGKSWTVVQNRKE